MKNNFFSFYYSYKIFTILIKDRNNKYLHQENLPKQEVQTVR